MKDDLQPAPQSPDNKENHHCEKVIIVVQRCGIHIAAGAERYSLNLAAAFADCGKKVEIFTSQSDSCINWNNRLPGQEAIQTKKGSSFSIRRFPVQHGRWKIVFAIVKRTLFWFEKIPFLRKLNKIPFFSYLFLRSQGPWCPTLWKTLHKTVDNKTLVVVKCYLYATGFYALQLCQQKARTLFIVTAHDEREFYLSFVLESLRRAHFLACVSTAEKNLCHRVWPTLQKKEILLLPPGLEDPIQTPEPEKNLDLRPELKNLAGKKFFLSLGRVEKRKNIGFLFETIPEDLLVVFAGEQMTPIPPSERFCYVGVVSSPEKEFLFRHALALLMVSRHEAYSMVTAEAIAHGCFVLALQGCNPVDELIATYGGGLSCQESDFKAALREMWQETFPFKRFPMGQEKILKEKSWNQTAQTALANTF